MTLANKITILRILGVPVFILMLVYYTMGLAQGNAEEMYRWLALVIFVALSLTDALDGYFARSRNEITPLGRLLDPIADKALLASSFITLSVLHIIPGWLTVIVISRDFIILLGISFLSIMSIPVTIRPLFVSRVTTTLQLITVLAALSSRCMPGNVYELWLLTIYWVTALFTIISGLRYMTSGVALISRGGKE
ncbi:MAG TPA: CDP-diacylglycerol--glycerol-3-phosphate 3-phosphatidyltransferase [Syntrophobacteraceae bacterium]|nr:CDP-diacylglycerol--glycerol-3-phosphate 3-phosphatidyltransferase [Syntrophobacteraceae bacterium]